MVDWEDDGTHNSPVARRKKTRGSVDCTSGYVPTDSLRGDRGGTERVLYFVFVLVSFFRFPFFLP